MSTSRGNKQKQNLNQKKNPYPLPTTANTINTPTTKTQARTNGNVGKTHAHLITILKKASAIFSGEESVEEHSFDEFITALDGILQLTKNGWSTDLSGTRFQQRDYLYALGVLAQAYQYFFGMNFLPNIPALKSATKDQLDTLHYIQDSDSSTGHTLREGIGNPFIFSNTISKTFQIDQLPQLTNTIEFKTLAPLLTVANIKRKIPEINEQNKHYKNLIKTANTISDPEQKQNILDETKNTKKSDYYENLIQIANTISDPEQKKNALEKIQRAETKEILVTEPNVTLTKKEEALNSEIRKNLEKELSATFIIIQDKVVMNPISSDPIETVVKTIDWDQWGKLYAAYNTKKADGTSYTNLEKFLENNSNQNNPNRTFSDCTMPEEIILLFQNDIEKLNQFSIETSNITALTNICLGKSTPEESSSAALSIIINGIINKTEMVSKAILENPYFKKLIGNSEIENPPKRIQEFILMSITSSKTNKKPEPGMILFKVFEAKTMNPPTQAPNKKTKSIQAPIQNNLAKPKTPLLFGGYFQAEKKSNSNTQRKTLKTVNAPKNPALKNWNPNQNSIWALLQKILPQIKDSISPETFRIGSELKIKKESYEKTLEKRNPVSKFFQTTVEFISGFFTRKIGEHENLIFQEKIASLFQNYYENKISIFNLKDEIDKFHTQYQSSFFKPAEFDSFIQIQTLVHQATEIETRKAKTDILSFWDALKSNQHENDGAAPTSRFAEMTNQEILKNIADKSADNLEQSNQGHRYLSEISIPKTLTDLFKPELKALLFSLKETYPKLDLENPENYTIKDCKNSKIENALTQFHEKLNTLLVALFKNLDEVQCQSFIKTLFGIDSTDNVFISQFKGKRNSHKKALMEEFKFAFIGAFCQNYSNELFPGVQKGKGPDCTSDDQIYYKLFFTLLNSEASSSLENSLAAQAPGSTYKMSATTQVQASATKVSTDKSSVDEIKNETRSAGNKSDNDYADTNISGGESPANYAPLSDSEESSDNEEIQNKPKTRHPK